MHAVVVSVRPPEDLDVARQRVETEVVPRARQNPGFVAGYWMAPVEPRGGAFSVVLFEDEASARAAADRIRVPDEIELIGIEVREVVASATA